MRRILQSALFLSIVAVNVLAQGSTAPDGLAIDRIVAVVQQRVITESDWDRQERLEALLDGRASAPIPHTAASLQRLVERVLILQQMSSIDFTRTTPQDVDKYLADIRKQLGAEPDAAWQALLTRYGLESDELRTMVAEQLDTLRFLDVKFRAGVRIPQRDVERYYNETFVPQMMAKSTTAPPLEEVRAKIVTLLTEQQVNALLDAWLNGLKAEGAIRWLAPVPTPPAATIADKKQGSMPK